MTLQDFVSIIGILGGALAIFIAWRKLPSERRGIDASSAEIFEKAATSAAARATKMEERIEHLEGEYETLKVAHEQLREDYDLIKYELASVKAENTILRTWAAALVNQLREKNIEPVPMPEREKTRPRPK